MYNAPNARLGFGGSNSLHAKASAVARSQSLSDNRHCLWSHHAAGLYETALICSIPDENGAELSGAAPIANVFETNESFHHI